MRPFLSFWQGRAVHPFRGDQNIAGIAGNSASVVIQQLGQVIDRGLAKEFRLFIDPGKFRLLRFIGERDKPYIRLCLPRDCALVQAARCRGAHDQGHYAWQIKIVDVCRLLRTLAPVLDRRIANSPFAGLTRDVCLNLYREAFELRFREGRLSEVVPLGFSDQGGTRIPPLLLAPLVLGYRSREELAQARHDFSVWGEWQPLIDVLFPKMASFLYTVY